MLLSLKVEKELYMTNLNFKLPYNDKRTLISKYLEVLNVVNPNKEYKLTDSEIKILTEFLLLPEKYSYQRFSRYAKSYIKKILKENSDWNLTTLNLNSKIYELLRKEFLWRDDDGVIYIKKYLIDSLNLLLKQNQPEFLITFVTDDN